MSQAPPPPPSPSTVDDPRDDSHAVAGASGPAVRAGSKKRRLLLLGAVLIVLVGAGALIQWKAFQDERTTEDIRKQLETEGIEVSYRNPEGNESFNLLESWRPSKVVAVHATKGKIKDADLATIAGINQDLNLNLGTCPITNDGLAKLEGKGNIRWLQLSRTGINNDAIKHLKGMNLQELDLSATKINDGALATLGEFNLPRLQILTLENTGVTDEGLKHLERFKSLEFLMIGGTKVSKEGRHRLKSKIPGLSIVGSD